MTKARDAAITRLAPAKVNLGLRVLGRRADGYHMLDSLVAFADFGDQITVAPSTDLSLNLSGPFASDLCETDDNIVMRAARTLGEGRSARIALEKNLPVASGIGGGSADAAATLHALNDLWGLAVAPETLAELGLRLGADVPVCLFGSPARMTGIGEVLQRARLPSGLGLLLVNPGAAVSTKAVFQTLNLPVGTKQAPEMDLNWDNAEHLTETLSKWPNDMEEAARILCPGIGQVLDALNALHDRLIVRMSGSGATCFALFRTVESAEQALHALDMRAGWWARAGGLLGDVPSIEAKGRHNE